MPVLPISLGPQLSRLFCLHELVLNYLSLLMEQTNCTTIFFSPLVQDLLPLHAYTRLSFIFLFRTSKLKPISRYIPDGYGSMQHSRSRSSMNNQTPRKGKQHQSQLITVHEAEMSGSRWVLPATLNGFRLQRSFKYFPCHLNFNL